MLCDKILHSVEGKCYFKKTNKLVDKEMRFVVTRGGRWEEAEVDEGRQRYKLPVVR